MGDHVDLQLAVHIAWRVHYDQVDKQGMPYILHCCRIAEKFENPVFKAVALMHDSLEDATDPEWVMGSLERFPQNVREAVVTISRKPMEDYFEYVGRVHDHPIARQVKIADLYDNLDPHRAGIKTDADFFRVRKYHRALEILRG